MGKGRYALALAALTNAVLAVNNGLAITPAMGWDNWNAFGCSISQSLILNTASVMKKAGLLDVGYTVVLLDDCWSKGRDSSGRIVADPTKFPNGMAYVGNQLHSSGFRFGMYSDAGSATCAGYAASLGTETIDAQTFAGWGVDYLKYDNCNNEGQDGTEAKSSARYTVMAKALNATGRPILYGICNWGEDSPWDWAPAIGNSWRISGDIYDNYNSNLGGCGLPGSGGYECSVLRILSKAATIATRGSKGGWNDLDMLEVGNGGMSDDQYLTHFSMWSLVKSPLIMGTDVTKLPAADFSILANPAIIAINQDPLGVPATLKTSSGSAQVWSGPVASTTAANVNDLVVALMNTGGSSATVSASISTLFGSGFGIRQGTWEVRDLWGGRLTTAQAQSVLSNGAAANPGLLYNATATSYAAGLAARNSLLLGTSFANVTSSGTVSATVNAYGIKVFRLRAVA